jgi:hypothetical protein
MEEDRNGNFYGHYSINIPSRRFSTLANGIYYVLVAGETTSGIKVASKPKAFIILR